MIRVFLEMAGWGGAGCMLVAYGLLCTKRLQAGPVFQAMNLAGASGLVISGVAHRAWPSVALNLIWVVISVISLAKQRDRNPLLSFREQLEDSTRTLVMRCRRYLSWQPASVRSIARQPVAAQQVRDLV